MALVVFKESFSTEIKPSKYPTGEKKSGARKAKEGEGEKVKSKVKETLLLQLQTLPSVHAQTLEVANSNRNRQL